MKSILTAIVAASSLFVASSSFASSFRCGQTIAKVGDRAFQVQEKCGEPSYKESIGYTVSPNKDRELIIEEWVYREGSSMHILRFVGSRLEKIEFQRMP